MRTFLLTALVALSALSLAPQASAACEPLLDPTYCTGTVRPIADDAIDTTLELAGFVIDTVRDFDPELPRCWSQGDYIYCEMDPHPLR